MMNRERTAWVTALWERALPPHRRAIWSLLLAPAAAYAAATTLRTALYRMRRPQRAGVRVIGVGNLTVGGNGKTPLAIYLGRKLRARGIATGIVSRGYGGSRGGGPALMVANGNGDIALTPDEAGDEPAMIAKSFGGPVAIARRRIEAIAMLERECGIEAAVVDDAYQHLGLHRDVNLLVVGAQTGFGNGWMLPAGPMRERMRAIKRADAGVLMSIGAGCGSAISGAELRMLERLPRLFQGRLMPKSLIQSERGRWREMPLALSGRRVIAVSSIANARSFAAMLSALEADLVGVLEYSDHHVYDSSDWHSITAAARDGNLIVTTEKDLVKLERFPFARDSLYALRLEVSMGRDEEALLGLVAGEQGGAKAGVAPGRKSTEAF